MEIHIIIEILLASTVLMLLVVNNKAIKLLLIRHIYGSYSYNYIKYHKTIFLKNPYPPCIQDDLIVHCFNFIDINPETKVYATKSEISFGSYPFFTKLAVVKGKTIPNCFNIYKLSDKCTIKILGLKTEMFNNKIVEVYYFMNDIFFMGEYLFPDISKANCEQLIGVLEKKYNISGRISDEEFYVQDDQDSLLFFGNNGFSISIQYINNKKPYINELWDAYFKNAIKKDILITADDHKEIFSKL